jgi:Fe-S-cluster containining protein
MSLHALYQKVAAFEAGLSDTSRALSQCKKGCSQCCHVDLSVFRIESDAIREWLKGLSEEKRNKLRELWKRPVEKGHCEFLYDGACSIYEARPLICRTQGLPLRFHEGGQTYVDVCPLNEEMIGVVTGQEIINLDLLNLILSQLEKENGPDRPRERLADIKKEFY